MSNPTDTPEPTGASLPATIRCNGWTPEKQSAFLRALASTHCVAQAARAAGMSRQSAYALRARLKGEPFDLAWHAALQCRFDALAEASFERALNGVEVPHFYRGELVGTSRRFDERLTIALLAMRAQFAPRRMPHWHGASQYGPADFGPLVERVERGPETWEEEARQEMLALDCEDDEWDEEGMDGTDEA